MNFMIRRVLQTLVVLVLMSFVSYAMMALMPGDPLDIACAANPRCNPENIQEMKRQLGLDRPITERFAKWAVAAVQGDLGYSRTYQRPVTEILGPRLVNSIILGLCSSLLALLLAIPLGILVGVLPRSKIDYVVNMFCFVGVSSPSFWLGLMLIYFFSVRLGWLPAGGVETIDGMEALTGWAWFTDRLYYLILPVLTLTILTIAGWVRQTRSAMIEVMTMDYIRTARAKGLAPLQVILKHGVRNAMLPVVTVVALGLSGVFSGAVITETVFAYNGVGKLLFDSILANDYNVAMCAFVVSCAGVLIASLVADLAYAALDPRIKLK